MFEPRDIRAHSDAAIVDETFARQLFPNQNPVGERFFLALTTRMGT
jgi:hypothetical protein